LFTAINAEDKKKILVGKYQGVKFLKGPSTGHQDEVDILSMSSSRP
jgi:hypothetical protein